MKKRGALLFVHDTVIYGEYPRTPAHMLEIVSENLISSLVTMSIHKTQC